MHEVVRHTGRSLPLVQRNALPGSSRTASLFPAEADKLLAVLDALPASIVLVDPDGVITCVNASWRRFAEENALDDQDYGIGASYLQVCEGAAGACSDEAEPVAEGLRAVLTGVRQEFALEYPCHAPWQERWFQLRIAALPAPLGGAAIMHFDITARRVTEELLRHSEAQYRQIADNVGDIFFLIDRSTGHIEYVSPAFVRMFGFSRETLYARPDSWLDAIHPEDREMVERTYRRGVEAGAFEFECRIIRPDGCVRWMHSRGFPVRDADGRIIEITGCASDVTQRKQAEARLRYLSRVHATLSGINSLVVRASNREELLWEACRIAVDEGGFNMAWLALLDQDNGRLVPMASAGMSDSLMELMHEDLLDDGAAPCGLLVDALMDGHIATSTDLGDDARVRLREHFVRAGGHSLAVVPLITGGRSIGVLALFASEVEFFHDEERALLEQLADDIGFALDHLDKSEQVERLSYYDELTGLANRRQLLEHIGQLLRGDDDPRLILCLLDIERFRQINHGLGHAAGDQLLRLVADWLRQHVGDASLLARLGSDLFAVVLPESDGAAGALRRVEGIVSALRQHPFRVRDSVFRLGIKGGYATYPETASGSDALFRNAEAAVKAAKRAGDMALGYTSSMHEAVAEGVELEHRLRLALDRAEFVLHYQPKIRVADDRVVGAEALIRWRCPERGLVAPDQFIPKLEETGLIRDVGAWALRQAVQDLQRWHAAGHTGLRVAVNVSALQLRSRHFLDEVEALIGADRALARCLEFEITESVIMEDVGTTVAMLRTLRSMGARVAIDDFGTGFSSLSYLTTLPVDALKIDRSFIGNVCAGPQGLALVSTVIHLAHSLKLHVVAEGVENSAQAQMLRVLDCDEMQGFLIGKGVPRADFEAFLRGRADSDPGVQGTSQ